MPEGRFLYCEDETSTFVGVWTTACNHVMSVSALLAPGSAGKWISTTFPRFVVRFPPIQPLLKSASACSGAINAHSHPCTRWPPVAVECLLGLWPFLQRPPEWAVPSLPLPESKLQWLVAMKGVKRVQEHCVVNHIHRILVHYAVPFRKGAGWFALDSGM